MSPSAPQPLPQAFAHRGQAQRIVFGAGERRRVPDEVARLSGRRVMVITGGSARTAAEPIVTDLGDRVTTVFGEVAQHVPEDLAERAVASAGVAEADLLLSVGGGSATGLAKAVAVDRDLPIVAVPTTFSGSERTPIWAVTGDRKRTGRDPRALPATVVYDPEMSIDLPPRVSAASGMNALAQAVAALTHEPHDPIAGLAATEAVRSLVEALPRICSRPRDVAARGRGLYGTCLGTGALAATGTGLHHSLAHILGGRERLVHADVHAVLLPHTTARLAATAAEGLQRLRRALGGDDPATALHDLAVTIGAPRSLAAIGVDEAVHEVVLTELDPGRHGLTVEDVRALLADAQEGGPPRTPGPSAR